jgi:hypothetical protein
MIVVCDLNNNPPSMMATGGFGFDICLKREGKSFAITNRELMLYARQRQQSGVGDGR